MGSRRWAGVEGGGAASPGRIPAVRALTPLPLTSTLTSRRLARPNETTGSCSGRPPRARGGGWRPLRAARDAMGCCVPLDAAGGARMVGAVSEWPATLSQTRSHSSPATMGRSVVLDDAIEAHFNCLIQSGAKAEVWGRRGRRTAPRRIGSRQSAPLALT